MLRWLAAAGAVVLVAAAILMFHSSRAATNLSLPSAPTGSEAARPVEASAVPLPVAAETVTPEDREAKRLARYDKDKDGLVSRDEYLALRHKAFAKLDTDGDGKLSFAEYSVKAVAKFDDADKDKSGKLSATEFARTAPVRKARKVVCPPTAEADN